MSSYYIKFKTIVNRERKINGIILYEKIENKF